MSAWSSLPAPPCVKRAGEGSSGGSAPSVSSGEPFQWELGSRILFWLAAIVALAVMPWEFKIAAGVLLLARFAIVLVEARRISRRLGEEKICGRYFLYDLLSPFFALLLGLLLLRKDERVWR